ncbi:MAG TPA: sulfate adenylyltransferase subunit CysN [Wenzhouxiangellaceae bacterium]|nr:sulfate adenylyltransferase subunit CysN [Wenzhouxiangellaceae bacterium]
MFHADFDAGDFDIGEYLEQHRNKELLRFITCGSVDDGKSTLIGRLLFDTKQVFEDQLAAVGKDSRKYGTTGEAPDLALLVDGLQAEREQGITIDVAYRYFTTEKRKFIIADTPGHEQYTRNMVTGASTADLAIVLIDARHGLQVQTRRHSYLVHMLGIRHVVVAINKMDAVDYDHKVYQRIRADYEAFANQLGIEDFSCVPVCALNGANVTRDADEMDWYEGPTVLDLLESSPVHGHDLDRPMRFPVQYVNRTRSDFRGFCGTLVSGRIAPGDEVVVLPSGRRSRIAEIIGSTGATKRAQVEYGGAMQAARAGQAITLTLADEIDISRGDVLVRADRLPRVSELFDARVVWMNDRPLLPGRQYNLKLAASEVPATPEAIHHRIDVNTLEHHPAEQLELNEIGYCRIRASRALAFDAYDSNPATGAFILVDRVSNLTVGAGMIVRPVTDQLTDKSSNVTWHAQTVNKRARAQQKAQKSAVLWFTGLSGAGKSTVANALEKALFQRGHHSYLLDGDNVRHGLNRDLGFSDDDRVENIRRIGEVARLMADAGLVVLTAFISPFRADRAMVRELMEDGEFVEIHVDAPLDVCETRDPKGLYAKARAGVIRNFTGIDSPYEPPEAAEIIVDTSKMSVDECVEELLAYLKRRGILIG